MGLVEMSHVDFFPFGWKMWACVRACVCARPCACVRVRASVCMCGLHERPTALKNL